MLECRRCGEGRDASSQCLSLGVLHWRAEGLTVTVWVLQQRSVGGETAGRNVVRLAKHVYHRSSLTWLHLQTTSTVCRQDSPPYSRHTTVRVTRPRIFLSPNNKIQALCLQPSLHRQSVAPSARLWHTSINTFSFAPYNRAWKRIVIRHWGAMAILDNTGAV